MRQASKGLVMFSVMIQITSILEIIYALYICVFPY